MRVFEEYLLFESNKLMCFGQSQLIPVLYRSYKRQSRALHFGRNDKACTALSRNDNGISSNEKTLSRDRVFREIDLICVLIMYKDRFNG